MRESWKRVFLCLVAICIFLCISGQVNAAEGRPMVSLGAIHGGAIDQYGQLWMWGNNDDGQIGDSTNQTRLKPVKIMENVKKVVCGNYVTFVLKENGEVWQWGDNKGTPQKMLDNVIDIYGQNSNVAAIKNDGSLWVWGENHYGQIGDGTTYTRSYPVQIMRLAVEVNTENPDYSDSIVYDKNSNAIYKINGNEVEFVAPIFKNVYNYSIPNCVFINGKNYKVTFISKNAFKNNKKIKKIQIGKYIERIGSNAFYGCSNLDYIGIKTKKLRSRNIGNKAFKEAGKKTIKN